MAVSRSKRPLASTQSFWPSCSTLRIESIRAQILVERRAAIFFDHGVAAEFDVASHLVLELAVVLAGVVVTAAA